MLELYKNIKMKRQEHGWNQSELAKKMGYSDKSMIAKIEKGSIDLSQSKIEAFANVFGCTPSELMGWTEITENDYFSNAYSEQYKKDALALYGKYIAADAKTRKMIDMLLSE